MDSDNNTRLEEALLFAERRADDLAEQVLALSGRVEALADRLGVVESLLWRVAADEAPPGDPHDPAG